MDYVEKLNKIMEVSGWTKGRLSDLLDVSYPAFLKWLEGETEPTEEHAKLIDKLYLMVTDDWEEARREYFEGIEKRLLRRQVRKLDDNNPKKRYL
jgi:transcriptional regulator with XRE-family HTH domain